MFWVNLLSFDWLDASSAPVGVVMSGSQLIKLLPYDKEFIDVSEMVGVVINTVLITYRLP